MRIDYTMTPIATRLMKYCVAPLLLFATPISAFAVTFTIDAGFGGDCGDGGLPKNWAFHQYGGYMPKADVEAVEVPGVGCALHYHNARGKSGSAINTIDRRAGRDGDFVTLSFKARGTGTAFGCLYCWTDDGRFVRTLSEKNVSLTPEWKTHELEFTLEDGMDDKTRRFSLAIGIKPGADAWFADVKALRSLETVETLAMDDFESPASRVSRAGAPEIISANIAPGLLVETRQGVYKTDGGCAVSESAAFSMPTNGEFLSVGARIYGIDATPGGDARLYTRIVAGTNRLVAAYRRVEGSADVECAFAENGRRLALHRVPTAVLPADFVVSIASDGTVDFAVTSLADSSARDFTFAAPSLSGAAGTVDVSRTLVANGGRATATLDNLFVSRAEMKRLAAIDYPYEAKPQPTFDPVAAGWPLVFSDEFDGTAVDTNKWRLTGEKWKREYASLSGDGRLLIKADVRPGKDELGTACLRSRLAFLHGYFEARVKFTRQRGWWAAFWLCSYGIANPFVNGMEIDIFEDYYIRAKPGESENKKTLDHNLHIQGTDVLKSYNYNSTLPGSLDDFYVIGCKWTPWEISYYLNGKLIQSKSTHSPYKSVTFDAFRHGTSTMPLHAIVSGQIMNKGWGAIADRRGSTFPETYEVDYVRVYALPGDGDGMRPQVSVLETDTKRVIVKTGETLSFRADAKPAPNTGSPVRAVHLFDSGYCIGTCRQPPYEFKVTFKEEWFSKTSWMRPGRSKVQPKFAGSFHAFSFFAEDEAGNVGFTQPLFMMCEPSKPSTPYGGVPQAIPGTLVIGRYDEGGEGVAYHDTTKGNGHPNKTWRPGESVDCDEHSIGSLAPGEWLRFTVDVKAAGDYRLRFKYGTPMPAIHKVVFLCDCVEVGRLDLAASDEDDKWKVSAERETVVRMPAGRHALTVLTLGLFNYTDIVFEPVQSM